MIYILSWVIPLLSAIMPLLLLEITAWYFLLPLSVLGTFALRQVLIDVYGIHTIITYKLKVMDKEKDEQDEL